MNDRERGIVKNLVQIIWADREVSESERQMLGSILVEIGCTTDEIREVGEMMLTARDTASFRDQLPDDPESRRDIMRLMLAMSLADGSMDVAELRYLKRIAEHLGIGEEDLGGLITETFAMVHGDSE